MRKAVYAGSFDPITHGHLWLVEQGVKLFDELIVAIGTNPDKSYTFSSEERLKMVRQSIIHGPGITVDSFEGKFLVDYASEVGADYILRGIRSQNDYEYERGIRHVNSDLRPEVVTVFLMPPREIAEVSSSMIKSLIGPEGWTRIIGQYVPEPVLKCLIERYDD